MCTSILPLTSRSVLNISAAAHAIRENASHGVCVYTLPSVLRMKLCVTYLGSRHVLSQPKGVGGKGKPKEKKEETPATQALGAGKESLQQRQSIGGSTQADTDGTHSETSAVNDCEPGSFSVSGQKPCEPCAAGSYMPNSAARSCIRCAQGTFQNATGATACDSCGGDESSTTSGAGATSAKDCGNFPAVTGIQYMKYENQADETMTTLDGHTAVGDDSDWKPTLYGGALGPWFGGWWIAVYGKNLGKSQADLLDVRIGDLACRKSVWLSSTSSACMVPRGMGWNLPVTVELAGGQQAAVESKFSYEAPVVDSYHPRNGPPRGGFWVTIAGRNFGHLDTSPTASVGGRICLETYWMSNTQILCRGPPGVGGPSMLHHVDITFESAEHVQEMPRRLRNWVRSVLHKAGHSVSAKQNASKPVVEIDLKAANDPASSALVAKGDKSADKGKKAKPKKANTATSLAEMKQEWTEREQEVKAELSEVKASAREAELELLATYLERVEERDKEREEQEQAEKARRLAEYQAVLDAERKIREEEEAAAQARQKQEEMRKAIDKGTVEKKLDKFTKAREAARKKKLLGDANAALALTKSCTDLVELDCKTGNCKLITAPALASAACVVADLEKAANITRAAGMQETEAAKKAVALVFEIQTGLETGNKFLKNAEASVAKLAGKEGVQVETDGKAAKDVLGKARAAFQSAGVSGKNGLASVDALQVKVDDMLEQVARKAEAEREKHAQEGAAAVAKARLKMEEAQFVEARAAHGTAVVEYEMAGLKEKMALELAALLEKIGEAEEVATVRDAKAAALKRKELEEEEQRIAAEKERVRLEEEAKKAAEEEQRLKQLAEQERREEEEERKKKEAEEKKAREKREREEAEARRKREQEDKEKREREAEALRAAETKLQEEATAAAPGGDGASAGNLSDVCSSVGGVQTCSKPSPTASSPSPPPSDSATGPATDKAGEVPATESAAAAKAAADKMAADKAAAHEAAAKAAAEQKAAAEAPSKLAASSAAGQAPAAEKKAGLGMGVKPVMDAGKVQTGLQVAEYLCCTFHFLPVDARLVTCRTSLRVRASWVQWACAHICACWSAFSLARSHMCALSQVSKLVPTGAAAESGNVNEGDLLQAVDGVDVRLWPLKKLANEKVLSFALPQRNAIRIAYRTDACACLLRTKLERIALLIRAWLTRAPVRAQILGQAGTEVVLTLKSPSGAVKEVKLVRR